MSTRDLLSTSGVLARKILNERQAMDGDDNEPYITALLIGIAQALDDGSKPAYITVSIPRIFFASFY